MKDHMCCHGHPHKKIFALALLVIGGLFILQDLGMGILPPGLSIWHVLITFFGLKMLIHSC